MSVPSRVQCEISFPPQSNVTNILGKTFKPVQIEYRAQLSDGEYYEHAVVFGPEYDNTEVPLHDNGYPPMPEWFKAVAEEMRGSVEAANA